MLKIETELSYYKGMDAATLQLNRENLQQTNTMYEYECKRLQGEIAELRKRVSGVKGEMKQVEKALAAVDEAEKYVKEVKYEPIIYVSKRKKPATPDLVVNSWQTYKDIVVYYYEIYNANVLGMRYGKVLVKRSRDYKADEKGSFNGDLFREMLAHSIKKLYINKASGITINTGMLKKNIKDLEIL